MPLKGKQICKSQSYPDQVFSQCKQERSKKAQNATARYLSTEFSPEEAVIVWWIGCGGYFKSLLCEIWLSINAKGIREQSDERKTGKLNKYEGEYERERERGIYRRNQFSKWKYASCFLSPTNFNSFGRFLLFFIIIYYYIYNIVFVLWPNCKIPPHSLDDITKLPHFRLLSLLFFFIDACHIGGAGTQTQNTINTFNHFSYKVPYNLIFTIRRVYM